MKPWSQGWLIAAGAYPGFCSMKRLEVFLLPLDGMLVHRRSLPRNFVRFPQQIAGTNLYTCVERGTVRVKARARTRTTRSRVERTNHEATAPPTKYIVLHIIGCIITFPRRSRVAKCESNENGRFSAQLGRKCHFLRKDKTISRKNYSLFVFLLGASYMQKTSEFEFSSLAGEI